MSETDCVVVGGGPAGAAAAIQALQSGLEVTLVERSEFPRHRAGETLHPGLETLLRGLGVWDEVLPLVRARHFGTRVAWGESAKVVPFGAGVDGPWQGFQIWRADLDAVLLDRARSLGARILQPCAARGLLRDQERVTGVETDRGPLLAKFVLDASGCRQWLAKQLRIPFDTYSPRLHARYGYRRGFCASLVDEPFLESDSEGWTWIARVDQHVYQWTRLDLIDTERALDWVPACLSDLTCDGSVRGADVTWRLARTSCGPGFLLCGDSAAVLDPASSHGVLKAIMTGMMAAHAVRRLLDDVEPQRIYQEYHAWLAAGFHSDRANLLRFYESHPAWPACAPAFLRHDSAGGSEASTQTQSE